MSFASFGMITAASASKDVTMYQSGLLPNLLKWLILTLMTIPNISSMLFFLPLLAGAMLQIGIMVQIFLNYQCKHDKIKPVLQEHQRTYPPIWLFPAAYKNKKKMLNSLPPSWDTVIKANVFVLSLCIISLTADTLPMKTDASCVMESRERQLISSWKLRISQHFNNAI